MNSTPSPWLACTDVKRSSTIMPTKQPTSDVVMNSATLTLLAGTPIARAASLLPPTAKIQLPYLVRNSTNVAMAVASNHQQHRDPEVLAGEEQAHEEANRQQAGTRVAEPGAELVGRGVGLLALALAGLDERVGGDADRPEHDRREQSGAEPFGARPCTRRERQHDDCGTREQSDRQLTPR